MLLSVPASYWRKRRQNSCYRCRIDANLLAVARLSLPLCLLVFTKFKIHQNLNKIPTQHFHRTPSITGFQQVLRNEFLDHQVALFWTVAESAQAVVRLRMCGGSKTIIAGTSWIPPPTLPHSDFGPTPADSAALLSAADILPSRRCLRNVWPGGRPASRSETQWMQTGNKPAVLLRWKNIPPLQIQFPLKHAACFSKNQSNVVGREAGRACQTGIE